MSSGVAPAVRLKKEKILINQRGRPISSSSWETQGLAYITPYSAGSRLSNVVTTRPKSFAGSPRCRVFRMQRDQCERLDSHIGGGADEVPD